MHEIGLLLWYLISTIVLNLLSVILEMMCPVWCISGTLWEFAFVCRYISNIICDAVVRVEAHSN